MMPDAVILTQRSASQQPPITEETSMSDICELYRERDREEY